jgi:hypothetical protein
MERDREVKKADSVLPHFYHLPSQTRYNNITFKHEQMCGDIYVNCQSIIDYWEYREQEDFLEFKIKPDRQSVMAGKIILWEIDRATMIKSQIIKKLEKYFQFAAANQRQFTLAFATTTRRAKSIAKEFGPYRNGYVWFTAVDVTQLAASPEGNVFQTLDNRLLNIHQLI